MRRARAWAAWLALASVPCVAEEIRVVSAAPDDVSVTLYRDLFARVTETRTVDLPAGPVTLVFDGVVESLLPASASVAGAGRAIDESNHDFERLTPGNLLRKSVGKAVTLWRTNPRTGKVTPIAATVIAAPSGGVTFQTADGAEAYHCSGIPERLSFEEIPDGIDARPQLSIRFAAGQAGKRRLRVSYLAHGLTWSADYLGHVDAAAGHMDLRGWLTLRNLTGATFRNAEVQVVAGRLNLLDRQAGGTSLVGGTADYEKEEELLANLRAVEGELTEELARVADDFDYPYGCYPQGPPVFPEELRMTLEIKRDSLGVAEDIGLFPDYSGEELEEVVVTGIRGTRLAARERLADYQLYRLPVRTDLNARQTKQVAFIDKPAVKIDRFYAVRFASEETEDYPQEEEGDGLHPAVHIGWKNIEADGLGEPLPGGRVRIFEMTQDGPVFAGESDIRDSAVGAPTEFSIGFAQHVTLGAAMDVDVEPRRTWNSLLTRRVHLPMDLIFDNDKPLPVEIEIRQGDLFDFVDTRIRGASQAPQRKAGDYMWRITIPAHGTARLQYTVSARSSYASYR